MMSASAHTHMQRVWINIDILLHFVYIYAFCTFVNANEFLSLCRPDMGFRLISEQVSHHPPISAFHVESDLFQFHGSIHPKLRFWGKSVEVNPKGIITLELTK